MKDCILDIDHLMVSVADAQLAGECFERLGFTLTPRSILPGMSNRLICFTPRSRDRCNFVEFLALDDPARAPQVMRDVLTPTDRAVSLVMASRDVQAATRKLKTSGIETTEPMRFRRDWIMPGGEVISPEFIVSIPAYGQAPLYWMVIEYVNPELYRRAEFTHHPNGATGLAAVLAVASDPAHVADHCARLWGARITDGPFGATRVTLDHVTLQLLPPAAMAAAYPDTVTNLNGATTRYSGFIVTVSDLSALRRSLAAGNVEARPDGRGGLWVGPAAAHGCIVHFQEESRLA